MLPVKTHRYIHVSDPPQSFGGCGSVSRRCHCGNHRVKQRQGDGRADTSQNCSSIECLFRQSHLAVLIRNGLLVTIDLIKEWNR